jgi:hypothetical protein
LDRRAEGRWVWGKHPEADWTTTKKKERARWGWKRKGDENGNALEEILLKKKMMMKKKGPCDPL